MKIILDKSKKLDHKTYFDYPTPFNTLMNELMKNSDETDYKIYGFRTRKKIIPPELYKREINFYPDDPEFFSPLVSTCVSNYDPAYLKEKLLEMWRDPERIKREAEHQDEKAKNIQETYGIDMGW